MAHQQPKIEKTNLDLFHVRLEVRVDWKTDFGAAIKAGAPNTKKHSQIWEAQELYEPDGKKEGVESTNITLLGFRTDWESNEAQGFVYDKRLTIAHPRQVLAIGEKYPHLHKDINREFVGILSMKQHMPQRLPTYPQPCYLSYLYLYTQKRNKRRTEKREAGYAHFSTKWPQGFWFAVIGDV